MARESTLKATVRQGAGSSVARRLRRDGMMPGVLNDNKGKSEKIQVSSHEFERLMHDRVGETLIVDLTLDDGAPRKVLLNDIQHHPVTGAYLHADFNAISMTDKMRVRIPVRLVGEPVGVIQEGGVLEQPLREVEVECLPADLVEQIDLDVSALKIGDAAQVGSIVTGPNLTILTSKGLAVALVSAPKAEEEVAAPAEGAAAEPEVIGAKEGEEGEEGAAGEKKEGDDKGKKPGADDKGKKPAADDKGKKPAADAGKAAKGAAPDAKKAPAGKSK